MLHLFFSIRPAQPWPPPHLPRSFPWAFAPSWQTDLKNKSGQAPLPNNWWNDCSSLSAGDFSPTWQVVWEPDADGGQWTSAAERDQPGEVSASHLHPCHQLGQKIWKNITERLFFHHWTHHRGPYGCLGIEFVALHKRGWGLLSRCVWLTAPSHMKVR